MATSFFLHELAATGDAKQLEVLFRVQGVKDIDERDEDIEGQTALHWAVRRGHTACCDILLQNGADPSLRMYHGWTPAHCAAEIGNVDILELLVRHSGEVLGEDNYGDTPKKVAQVYGHKHVVKFLETIERDVLVVKEGSNREEDIENADISRGGDYPQDQVTSDPNRLQYISKH